MKRTTVESKIILHSILLLITAVTLSEAFFSLSLRSKCLFRAAGSISNLEYYNSTLNSIRNGFLVVDQEDGSHLDQETDIDLTIRKKAVDVALSYKPTSFRPASFAKNPHVQTIGGAFLRGLRFNPQGPRLDFSYWPPLRISKSVNNMDYSLSNWWDKRVRILTPDGDFFDADYKYCPNVSKNTSNNNNNNNNEIYYAANETEKKMAQDPGLVVMVHGLESSSSSPQMIDAATAFLAINMDVICVNFRSCSGEPNRRPGAYHLGFTEDLRFFLSEILPQQNLSMKRDVYLVGFSLGANVILKLLGEMQTSAFSLYNVRGAAVSAAPFDLIKSAPKFAGTMFNRFIYDSNFLRTLKRKAINQYEMLREDVPYNIEEIKRAQSIAEFENAFIAPVYGFTDNVDYYRKTSCISFIDSIRVPTLVINSLDDPFFDPSCYPRECNSRPVKLHYTSYGGHLGFMLHQEPSCEDKATATTSSWMPSELARFFKHVRDSIHD